MYSLIAAGAVFILAQLGLLIWTLRGNKDAGQTNKDAVHALQAEVNAIKTHLSSMVDERYLDAKLLDFANQISTVDATCKQTNMILKSFQQEFAGFKEQQIRELSRFSTSVAVMEAKAAGAE